LDDTSSGAPNGEPWTFDQVVHLFFHEYETEDPFLGYCTACHQGGDDGGPIMPRTPDEFHTYLLNTESEACFEHKLVTPGDPETSALALILDGKCEGGTDRYMPPTSILLYPEELAGVLSWIAAGAMR
jgi:hypothetical protein